MATTTTVVQFVPSTASAVPATPPTTALKTVGVLGDRLQTGAGNFVQVYAYEQPVAPGNEFITPPEGAELAAIDVEGCAARQVVFGGFSEFAFVLVMEDNTRLAPVFPSREPRIRPESQLVGTCNRGWITFQLPRGVRPAAVQFSGSQPPLRWTL